MAADTGVSEAGRNLRWRGRGGRRDGNEGREEREEGEAFCFSYRGKKVVSEEFVVQGESPTMGQFLKHPLVVLAVVPKDAALFAAGAIAGAAAKTLTAPLDRVKLLIQ